MSSNIQIYRGLGVGLALIISIVSLGWRHAHCTLIKNVYNPPQQWANWGGVPNLEGPPRTWGKYVQDLPGNSVDKRKRVIQYILCTVVQKPTVGAPRALSSSQTLEVPRGTCNQGGPATTVRQCPGSLSRSRSLQILYPTGYMLTSAGFPFIRLRNNLQIPLE